MEKDNSKESKLEGKMKRKSSEVSVSEEKTYACNLCGKSFSNGHALGGHKNSHFKAKKENKHLPNKVFTLYDNDGEEKSTCNKNSPTKNTLDGHMSPPPNHDDSSKCSTSSSSDSSIDLNKEPKDDGHHTDSDDLSKSPLPKWQIKGKRGRKSRN